MMLAIGADHRGFSQKQFIKEKFLLAATPIEWLDVGCYNEQRSDYPEYAINVCKAIQEKKVDRGILLCGTGVGMSIVANRFAGCYAGIAWSEEIAHLNREHDNVNILILPSDYVLNEQAVKILYAWFNATFLGERYKERITMIDALGGVK